MFYTSQKIYKWLLIKYSYDDGDMTINWSIGSNLVKKIILSSRDKNDMKVDKYYYSLLLISITESQVNTNLLGLISDNHCSINMY